MFGYSRVSIVYDWIIYTDFVDSLALQVAYNPTLGKEQLLWTAADLQGTRMTLFTIEDDMYGWNQHCWVSDGSLRKVVYTSPLDTGIAKWLGRWTR